MQPAKTMPITASARQTKVIVDPVQPDRAPVASAPAERVAHAPSPRQLVLGRGPTGAAPGVLGVA